MSAQPPRPYDGFIVSVTRGKSSRLDAPGVHDVLKPLHEADVAWAHFEVEDLERDAHGIASVLGFSSALVDALLRAHLSEYDDRDGELGLLVPLIRVEDLQVNVQPLQMLVRENFVLTIYRRGRFQRFRKFARYAETAMRKMPPDLTRTDRLTALVTRLLDENNERNFDGIRNIQEHGERIAACLADEAVDRRSVAPQIYAMKQALIRYLDALWASLDVLQALRHGDAELVTDDATALQRIALLADDVQRHIQLSEHMSEVLASGLEVMQGIYNNQLQALNNRMSFVITWLTVLGTAVLVPNTLATVLSAAPPALQVTDPATYVVVMAGSTVAATAGAYAWIRRSRFIPHRLD